jgi:hypothetical protein
VTDLQAACLEPIKLCHLLKERFPFLRIDTVQRVADVICALIEKQTTNQKNLANGLCCFSTGHLRLGGVPEGFELSLSV